MAKKGENTKNRILTAARTLVLERGFTGTSLDDILDEAGLTKGAFFYHFKNKQDLARELIGQYGEDNQTLFEHLSARTDEITDDPLESVLTFLRLFEQIVEEQGEQLKGCLLASYVYERQQFDPSVQSDVRACLQEWSRLYEERFAKLLAVRRPRVAVTAEELAEMIVCIIEGGLILYRSYGDYRLMLRQLRQFRAYLELLFSP